jgi:predicted DNA-binding transcriptional regulator AlpA
MDTDLQVEAVHSFPDGRMDTQNASKYVGLSNKSMAQMRCEGTGPNFIKLGGKVFYYRSDLDTWINSGGKFVSTAQARLGK